MPAQYARALYMLSEALRESEGKEAETRARKDELARWCGERKPAVELPSGRKDCEGLLDKLIYVLWL